MNENELFVDNPLALTGLFGKGIFLPRQEQSESKPGAEENQTPVLVMLHYPSLPVLPPTALQTIGKIMQAVNWNGKPLTGADYAVVNSGRLPENVTPDQYLQQSKASKVILWSDNWPFSGQEIIFYNQRRVENVEILRCHSLHTVMADKDRKSVCWTAIQAFFR